MLACRRWIEMGAVVINGRTARKATRLAAGMLVEVTPPEEHLVPEPEAPLSLVLETEQLVLVDKPAGQPTAALSGKGAGTLTAGLVGRYPEMMGVGYGPLEPGVVHRLDTYTSGLVLAARDADTFQRLTGALAAGQITKRYFALVLDRNVPDSGRIESGLAPHPKNQRKVALVVSDPIANDKAALVPGETERLRVTSFSVVERRSGVCVLDVSVSRAYRHQIRAHLAARGMPLLGDELYGGQRVSSLAPGRHALHAYYVAWEGDLVVKSFEARLGLPEDLLRLSVPGAGDNTENTSDKS
jgi:23S rRNA pseudouridine1911/1915/1917 synthase